MKLVFLALVLLALGLWGCPTLMQAQFTITTNNGAITITGYTGSGGMVTIPGMTNGLPVTRIADSAFQSCSSIVNLLVPDSVTNIGDYAFSACGNLTNLTIGSGCARIGTTTFWFCTGLKAIAINTNNPVYSSLEGVLFDKNQTTLVHYPGGRIGSYTIPDSTTHIETFAFSHCYGATSVIIPDSVTNIEGHAFYVCGLTNVTIGNGVTSLPYAMFEGCSSLIGVTIGNHVTTIQDLAFASCPALTGITIPDSVTSIQSRAFSDCTGLARMTIPDNVTNVGDLAFNWCSGLTNVTIGTGLTFIGDMAFASCSSLEAITVDPLNSTYSSLDGVLFDKNQTALLCCPGGKIGNYTIPGSVTRIGDHAFISDFYLINITLPGSVTNIGDGVFTASPIIGLYFSGNAPAVGLPDFFFNHLTAYYLPNTTGWNAFSINYGVPAILWNPQVQASAGTFGVNSNHFSFNITGVENISVVVEACTNLGSAWIPLQSVSLTNGLYYFSDPEWTNYPSRFYRFRSP